MLILIIIIATVIVANQLSHYIVYDGAINDTVSNYIKNNLHRSRTDKDVLYVGEKIITKTKYDLFYKYVVDDAKPYGLTSYHGRIFRWSKMAKLMDQKLIAI